MAAAKIMQIWTVFITALVKCLAVLGFKATTEAAVATATTTTAPVTASIPALGSLTALLPRQRSGDRSVPPTMKQRIRAEAHGASPSSRSLSGRFGDAALAGALPEFAPELAVGDGARCPA
jgi:hypothetical protein